MVSLAKDLQTGEMVAIKCLTKANSVAAATTEFAIDELSQEYEFHSRVGNHPNVVNLLHSFETECHIFLVLEYCPMGDLYEAIRLGRGPLETEHVRDFMLQLVAAVEHMHSKGVYHRDIKPENIFLSQSGLMKLGDFGLATMDEWTDESAVGSDRYMAPEQYDSVGGYSPEKADIWAVGICLLNVLFARNPFVVPAESDPLFADYVLDRESLFDIFPTLSYDTYDVLTNCLALDPRKRSLAAVRDAIERVVYWTTDEEGLDDDFCTEDREVVPAPANREPLRTPSIQSPQIAQGASFPWAQALQSVPQPRQLSTISDREEPVRYREDMFENDPDGFKEMEDFVHVAPSLDSGLGASPSAMESHFKQRSGEISIKAPTATKDDNAFAVYFQRQSNSVSKSWSDWVIEDEEEEEREREEREKELKHGWSLESNRGDVEDDIEWVGGGGWDD